VRRFARPHRSPVATAAVEEAPRPLRGLRFDLEEQSRRLRQLGPLVRGFRAPEGFQLWNGQFESVDAEVLWAMVKGLGPHRVMVAGPNPMARKVLEAALPRGVERTEKPIELAARDLLIAGAPDADLVLGLLPDLSPGVVVHVHPIRLPWPGGPGQDLVHAFLSGNRHFEILLAHHALARSRPDDVRAAVPSWRGASEPASLWLRRA
jgi:hypothetical protein